MNRFARTLIAILLFILPMSLLAQQPGYSKLTDFNFHNLSTIEERVFYLHAIQNSELYCYNLKDENNINIFVSDGYRCEDSNANSDFDAFIENLYDEWVAYSNLDKTERGNLFVEWRYQLEDDVFMAINEDFHRQLRDNATCDGALPFCTNNGQYNFPAGVNAGNLGSSTQPYWCSGFTRPNGFGSSNCLTTTPNPAFYYMLIAEPGNLNILIYSSPRYDIDFDCWGPFSDINTACSQLSCSNMVDCSYNGGSDDEFCHINNAQTGQYYILLLTNYGNQACNVLFENIGTGTTDCGILPPLVNNDGPFCTGETIHLTANGQSGSSYSWVGPNGFSSTQQNPTITNATVEMSGDYTCTITLNGESSHATTEVIVNQMPEANFTATSVCKGTPTQFNAIATGNPSNTLYNWDFADGETGEGATVTHTYAEAGEYAVLLNAENPGTACNDNITLTVTVYDMPDPSASANPSSVEYNMPTTLTAQAGASGAFNFHWEPAELVVNPNAQSTSTVGLTQQTTVFTVTVTNPQGDCTATAQVTVYMAGSDLSASATVDDNELCEGESTTLHAIPENGTHNYHFLWSGPNGFSSDQQNPQITPAVGTSTYNCEVDDELTHLIVNTNVTVHPNAEPTDIYDSICPGGTYTFYNQTITSPNTYPYMDETSFGCDSLVRLHLALYQTYDMPTTNIEACNDYHWDSGGKTITSYTFNGHNITDETITRNGEYKRTYESIHGCDSIVTMVAHFEYTPNPTEILPVDILTPHWVIPATEFQINSYEYSVHEHNIDCTWDTVYWSCDSVANQWNLNWVNGFNADDKHESICTVTVLEHVEGTIYLTAHIVNQCDTVLVKYPLICSFYGTEEQTASQVGFNVVPNPNNGEMKLNFDNLNGKVTIKVYDMSGNLIDSFETNNEMGRSTMTYNMSHCAPGIYYFVVTAKEGTTAKKIIVTR